MAGSNLCILIIETARPLSFQNRIIMFCLPISTFMYLWAIYLFPRLDCRVPILGIYKSLTDPCIKKLGTAQFHCWEYVFWIFGTVWKSALSSFGFGVPSNKEAYPNWPWFRFVPMSIWRIRRHRRVRAISPCRSTESLWWASENAQSRCTDSIRALCEKRNVRNKNTSTIPAPPPSPPPSLCTDTMISTVHFLDSPRTQRKKTTRSQSELTLSAKSTPMVAR